MDLQAVKLLIKRRRNNPNLTGISEPGAPGTGLSSVSQFVNGTAICLARVEVETTVAPHLFWSIPVFPDVPVMERRAIVEVHKRKKSAIQKTREAVAAIPRHVAQTLQPPTILREKLIGLVGSDSAVKLIGHPGEAPSPDRKYYDVNLDEYQL
jgi:hypothetical protein